MPPTAPLPFGVQVARYLLGRGLLSVGVIVGEGPVEGGNVQAAVGPSEQAQPSLAGGGVAGGGIGVVQALRDALHQHSSAVRGDDISHWGPETTGWDVSTHLSDRRG